MCRPGWVRLTHLAGIGMAGRLHDFVRDSTVNRHAQKRLSLWKAGVVSESAKCPDAMTIESRDQTWTCRHWCRSKGFHGVYYA